MSGDIKLSKVQILIQQKKYADAERILKDLLSDDPTDPHYLSLLAEVNLQQDKHDIAKGLIDDAIGLSPDAPLLFYIRCRIFIQLDKWDEAEEDIDHAIELDPYDADYFAMLANIKLARKQYEEALDTADHALEIDPENLLALNTRSTALNKLNRSEESFATIEGALREDPNSAYTHANYGWGLLEKGDHKKALEHFKESLKNDPDFSYAQSGMLEALKAANPVYKLFLKYAFWMSNLTERYQWGVLLGFYFGVRLLRTIATHSKTLQPFLTPLIIALAIVAFSTWVITPISNLFLRFNKYGQLLLDKKQKISSDFVAASLVVCLAGLTLYIAQSDEKMLSIAAVGFIMMVPFSVMFSPSRYKNSLLIYAAVMAVTGVSAIALTFSSGELFNLMTTIFLIGFIAFQWLANYLIIKESNY